MKRNKKKDGFTLVELVVVLAVMALLAALIVGAIMLARKTARNTALRADAKTIKAALEGYYAKKRDFPSPVVGKDRMAYEMANEKLVPEGFMTGPMTNPSLGGTVCYNLLGTGAAKYYNLWVVSEESASTNICKTCNNTILDNGGNPCWCGMNSICGAEVFNGNNY